MRILSILALTASISLAIPHTSRTHAEENTVAEPPVASKQQVATAPTRDGSAKQKPVEPQVIELAGGKLLLPVPGGWKVVKPRTNIIKHEFSIPPVKGDKEPGRMTIMAAGGGVEANIDRWVGQFQTAEGKPLGEDAKKITKKKMGDVELHVVDLTGDFNDSMRGPFGPKVKRPGYRMLAAIIPLEKNGTWFIKFYGPIATVESQEKAFAKMLDGVKFTP